MAEHKSPEIVTEQPPSDICWLPRVLGPEWTAGFAAVEDQESALDILLNSGHSWTAQVVTKKKRIAHAVVIDGANDEGHIMVRDPEKGTRYELTRDDFLAHWSGRAVYRK